MLTVMAGAVGLMASPVFAQEAAQPADGALPEVEVIQKKAPAAKKKAAPAAKAATPTPQPPPAYDYVDAEPAVPAPGDRASDGRVVDNQSSISPVDPSRGILPADTQNFTGSVTHVSSEQIEHQRPLNNHELLSRVPGVMVIQDDGMGRHANIGIRGSQARRSRKVLVMEDGVPINFAPYIDASTHYTPPTERIESVEVMRGMVVSQGPLTNHGVVNFRNLNPFGPNETVIKAAIGHTEGVEKDVSNFRHVHTRQSLGNVGVVVSYSGGDAGGAWDNEELGYNDFYGALGFRGSNQDLTISGGYFRQRDKYDEQNWQGTDADFFSNRRRKSGDPNGGFEYGGPWNDGNTYNADLYRIQAAHNWYIDSDTTLTTRLYHQDHERNRFEYRGAALGDYRGRERTYRFSGVDSRIEFANLPLFGGMTHDFQAGVRYEHHSLRNCNSRPLLAGPFVGGCRDVLDKYEADSFAAFLQTAIHVTRNLTITPGVRFENYDVDRDRLVWRDDTAQEGTRARSNHDVVLPGIAFAWEIMPRSTIYGGFHQGISPHIARNADEIAWPLPDEKGDNYELGFRTTAVRGLTLDFAFFHNRIDNFQIKGPESNALGNAIYGAVDEVEIDGFEIYTRLDSQPFTGGRFNVFGEATYTYADAEITKSSDVDAPVGNRVPESPLHYANLTLGIEERGLWDASVTWTYIGDFFADTENTRVHTDSTLGIVPDVWLLSARANYHVPNTALTLFVSGQNLTDEFYIADRNDGAKPGIGRTLWAGFTWKFDN
ncbi:hypothetical protein W911_14470 [Hyphomicrobium nitrativorans NL23]|uniref:TonB-denpendent receptor n=2 Tax=Hyphomicrobium TaxID=81 RepID=V5SII5_9HYPH|nr:hypothetical protein W911_14470 [Hyphomicrobium nitrativorans NL23]